jgi:hypothetical protein
MNDRELLGRRSPAREIQIWDHRCINTSERAALKLSWTHRAFRCPFAKQ